jgi:hypothetical protein
MQRADAILILWHIVVTSNAIVITALTQQEILEEFVRCEMYYHCRSLEVLAPALQHISGVDGETASEHIREELENLNAKLQYL